jgi:hypothetical protein
MNQRLKRWESPRNEGRNDKGKGGSARQRQKKKQFQMLRKKLKVGINQKQKEMAIAISFCFKENVVQPQEPVEQSLYHQLYENQFHQKLHFQTCNA